MQNLVSSLKSAGVPIDGVGLESHFIVGEVPTTIQQNMEAITALGVEVAITELDIRMTLPSTDALLAQQKTDYETVITACNAVPGCVGVTLWDYTDLVIFNDGVSLIKFTQYFLLSIHGYLRRSPDKVQHAHGTRHVSNTLAV